MESNPIRTLEYKSIFECLTQYQPFSEFPEAVLSKIAQLIERSINNSAIDKSKEKGIPNYWSDENFISQYSSVGYNVKINLDINSSVNKNKPKQIGEYTISQVYNYVIYKYTRFITQRVYGEVSPIIWTKILGYLPHFDPKKIGELSSIVLNPLINKPYVEQLHIREKQETQVKYSTMYQCACGERKTISYTLQIRSLDEGGTCFIKCLCCPRIWTRS